MMLLDVRANEQIAWVDGSKTRLSLQDMNILKLFLLTSHNMDIRIIQINRK